MLKGATDEGGNDPGGKIEMTLAILTEADPMSKLPSNVVESMAADLDRLWNRVESAATSEAAQRRIRDFLLAKLRDGDLATVPRHHIEPDANRRPDLVTLFAKEIRSGRTYRARLADLKAAGRLPFGNEADTLVESYSAVAELSCCLTANVPMPRNVLCTFAEASALINGLDIVNMGTKRPSLLEACELFGIAHMDKERKEASRDLILGKSPSEYTIDEWRLIENYNADDVETDIELFKAEAPAIDLKAALFRGSYAKIVAAIEHVGLPVDAAYVAELAAVWPDLKMHYIRELDSLRLYDDEGHFCEDRIAGLIEARGWSWPRSPKSGKHKLDSATFGKMVARHPELKTTQRLRDQIAELRLGAFVNTIGADGYSRRPIMPNWTRTGRNQPSGRDLAFLFGLPSWLHGIIKPPEGYALACLDWIGQETGIGAGLSGDPAMIADYLAGDPHLGLAIRCGLAPPGANKATHGTLRNAFKAVSLGVPYGITEHGVAHRTGKSRRWAREMLAMVRHSYPKYFEWQKQTVAQAVFDQRIVSALGFPMHVHQDTPERAVKNYQHQAGGSDMMKLGAVAGTAAGIVIVAPVHDAYWIMAPIAEIDDAISTMSAVMVRASAVITGGLEISVEVSAKVCWPDCLGDVRPADAKGRHYGSKFAGWCAVFCKGGQHEKREAIASSRQERTGRRRHIRRFGGDTGRRGIGLGSGCVCGARGICSNI
jgi:hypothetical protein